MIDILFLGGIVAFYVIFTFFVNWCEAQVVNNKN
jgi:hypothetical protein